MTCVLYLPFDEGLGSIAYDKSGNSNDGTLLGVTLPSWVTGKFGKALSFSGSNYVTVYNKPTLNPTAGITVACWIYITAPQSDYARIVEKGPNSYGMLFKGGGLQPYFYINTGGSERNSASGVGTNLSLSTWHLLIGTYDKKTVSVYVDGKPYEYVTYTTEGDIGTDSNDLTLAAYGAASYVGLFDEFRILTRACTATEAYNHFQNKPWQISNVVLPWAPRNVSEDQPPIQASLPIVGDQPDLTIQGLNCQTVTLNGFLYLPEYSKIELDLYFTSLLRALRSKEIILTTPDDRYAGNYLLDCQINEAAEGSLQRLNYSIMLIRGQSNAVLSK